MKPSQPPIHSILRFFKTFWRDDSGIILPYVTILLVVIVGMSVLALDGARYVSLNTQLQQGADALALAGAAELDGSPTAITRACQAITLVINTTLVGSSTDANVQAPSSCPGPATCPVTGSCIRFLSSLPASDSIFPIPSANVTTDPTQAFYVEVTVTPVSMATILPASFFGGSNTVTTGAQAVAGNNPVLCNFSPVYICNPYETSGMSSSAATDALYAADTDTSFQQKLIRLVQGCTNPGCLNYLIPTTGSLPASACGPSSTQGVSQALAMSEVSVCNKQSGVSLNTAPGSSNTIADGFNTRFGLYSGSFGVSQSCGPATAYPPDANVRKGYIHAGSSNWCNASPDDGTGSNKGQWPPGTATGSMSLPLDDCLINGTCSTPNVGDGKWDCRGYVDKVHGLSVTYTGNGVCGNKTTTTARRYDVYNWEAASPTLLNHAVGGETGTPQCIASGSTPLTGVSNRRIMIAPIVNCGSAPNKAAAFGKFFITLPWTTGNQTTNSNAINSPFAEFIGLQKPTYNAVQLYR